MNNLVKPVACAIALAAVSVGAEDSVNEKPNVIVIFADDLGYGDVSALNPNSKIQTPNIDRLAARGMTFTDGHSNAAVCTPSRYGLLTGRYCWRTRVRAWVLNGYSNSLIAPERMTLASLTKTCGYDTACFGKWHLGLDWQKEGKTIDYSKEIKQTPNDYGFDHFFGISASLDMPPYTWIENRRVTHKPDSQMKKGTYPGYNRAGDAHSEFDLSQALPIITRKATDFINGDHQGKPFFLYLPLPSPHKPVVPLDRFKGSSKAGPYGDYVVETDWAVGEVVKALDKKNVGDNTLIIFTSDNGSFASQAKYDVIQLGHAPNHVFRGGKTDVWEGGHRVPFIVTWPTQVKAGSRYDGTVSSTDVFATLAEILGETIADDTAEDSWSFFSVLKGETIKDVDARAWIFHSGGGLFALRKGKWKFIPGRGAGGRGGRGKKTDPPGQLYDMSRDKEETNNLFTSHPEVVKKLSEELEQLVLNGRSTPGTKQKNAKDVKYFTTSFIEYLNRERK